MNQDQKTYVRNWERTEKYKDRNGKEIKLSTIVGDAHRSHSVYPCSLPDYLNIVHPWLYFNYLIDWKNLPDHYVPAAYKNGESFGRAVISKWQDRCWKMKYFNSGNLNNYRTIDQLRENTDALLKGAITLDGCDAEECEYKLFDMRDCQLKAEEAERQAEIDRKRREKEYLDAVGDYNRAQQRMDEINRLEANAENEKNINIHRNIQTTTTEMAKPTPVRVETAQPVSDPFAASSADAIIDPFHEAAADILLAPMPSPTAMQVRITTDGAICFGSSLTRFGSGYAASLKRINGANYICFTSAKDSDCSELLKLTPYFAASRYVVIDLSVNESQNPNIIAFRILQVAFKD